MDLFHDKQSRRDSSMHSHHPRLFKILILAFAGLLVSIYLVYSHYHKSSSCDITPSFSCSVVNTSTYSEIFGVPVAVFGVLWNIFAIAGVWKILSGEKPLIFLYALLLWLGVGTVFVFYMIYAEFMIGGICPYCTLVHLFIGCMDYFILKIWMGLKTKPELVHLLQIKGYIIFVILFYIFVIFVYPSSAFTFTPPTPIIVVEKIDTQQNAITNDNLDLNSNSIPNQNNLVINEQQKDLIGGEEEEKEGQVVEDDKLEENEEEDKSEPIIEWDGNENTYLVTLAKCMKSQGVQMFGSDHCGVCMRQKSYFGSAFSEVIYTDCSKTYQTKKCEQRQIKSYPTWVIIDQQDEIVARMSAYAESQHLEEFSGCLFKTKVNHVNK